jgi:hypothetical protein
MPVPSELAGLFSCPYTDMDNDDTKERSGKPQAHAIRLQQTARERQREKKIRELKRQHRFSDPIE